MSRYCLNTSKYSYVFLLVVIIVISIFRLYRVIFVFKQRIKIKFFDTAFCSFFSKTASKNSLLFCIKVSYNYSIHNPITFNTLIISSSAYFVYFTRPEISNPFPEADNIYQLLFDTLPFRSLVIVL